MIIVAWKSQLESIITIKCKAHFWCRNMFVSGYLCDNRRHQEKTIKFIRVNGNSCNIRASSIGIRLCSKPMRIGLVYICILYGMYKFINDPSSSYHRVISRATFIMYVSLHFTYSLQNSSNALLDLWLVVCWWRRATHSINGQIIKVKLFSFHSIMKRGG